MIKVQRKTDWPNCLWGFGFSPSRREFYVNYGRHSLRLDFWRRNHGRP